MSISISIIISIRVSISISIRLSISNSTSISISISISISMSISIIVLAWKKLSGAVVSEHVAVLFVLSIPRHFSIGECWLSQDVARLIVGSVF